NTVRIKTLTRTSGATYIASPKVTADFRFNYSRNQGVSIFAVDELGGSVPPADGLLFPSPHAASDSLLFFRVAPGGRTPVLTAGPNSDNLHPPHTLVAHVSVLAGGPQLKFGAD